MKYYKLTDKLPNLNEPIAVDTQIVYWLFYADEYYIGMDKPYQVTKYSEYINEILENGNKLVIFGNVLAELFKIIEINEYKLYLEFNGYDEKEITLKEYRKIKKEREIVKSRIDIAYKQIKQVATIVCDTLSVECCNYFVDSFEKHGADFVDFSIVHFCKEKDIKFILTDDRDFMTVVSDISIISGNRKYFDNAEKV